DRRVYQITVFAEIVLLGPADFRSVNVDTIAVTQDGFLVRRDQIDAHPAVAADFDLTRLRGAVIDDHGHLSTLNTGREAFKLILLAIHLLENVVQRQRAGGQPGRKNGGPGEDQEHEHGAK